MRTLATVTIKRLDAAKQRLASDVSPRFRAELVEAMLQDVLAALGKVRGFAQICVVTQDADAHRIAAAANAIVVCDPEQAGQSEAAMVGQRYAARHGYERVFLLPADTPLVDQAEIDGLLAQSHALGRVTIVPDRHGEGTNGLLMAPALALEPSFGKRSCARHRHLGQQAGLVTDIAAVESLALDIDTADDLAQLVTALTDDARGASYTRTVLARYGSQLELASRKRLAPRGGAH